MRGVFALMLAFTMTGCAASIPSTMEVAIVEEQWLPVLSHDMTTLIGQTVPLDKPLKLAPNSPLSARLDQTLREAGYAISPVEEGSYALSYTVDDLDGPLLVMRVSVLPWLDGGRLYEKTEKGLEPVSLLSVGSSEDGASDTASPVVE